MHATTTNPPLRSSHDVIVVGGGAAGAATAMLLARSDLRILLLDQASPRRYDLSSPALLRGGVLQLSRWGLLDGIIAAATPPVRQMTFRHGDEELVMSIKPSHGVDALYAPAPICPSSSVAERRHRCWSRGATPHGGHRRHRAITAVSSA